MKLRELWEAMKPYTDRMYGEWLSMGQRSLMYRAFRIAFWQEVEYWMVNHDYDCSDDEIEGLAEVDPKFFFDEVNSAPVDDEHAAEIFIPTYSTAYEYFTGLVNQIIREWRESHGKAEEET